MIEKSAERNEFHAKDVRLDLVWLCAFGAAKYLTIYSGTFWLLISLGISWHIPEKMVQNFRPGT